ncbi:MAG: ATP-grasp domain-containing protein [Oscillatoriophycideae cyanobacterium NC_groundwater_1537_Pr4_S-0.65um_50_18]|nr:ATP-grasp domain-containing protein [Oscillatoriophycideae cyanobacterium NC_groundwater_1537_Pr4_S-0.65um_50_18]
MIVLSQAPESIATQMAAQIAQILGLQVYTLSSNFGLSELKAAICSTEATFGVWLGEPPQSDRYKTVYEALLTLNVRLFNRPDQYAIARQFHPIYDRLQDLTPADILTPPTAQAWTEVRQQANLRYGESLSGILQGVALQDQPLEKPLGRAFRVYLYHQTIVTYAYSWAADDPLKWLTVEEEEAIFAVALEAATRIDLPLLAIDIGQQQCGRWVVLEVGDAQFSLLCQMSMIPFWGELERLSVQL